MKTKLILINWLFAWVPLCYAGDDPVIAIYVVGWFGCSSWLLYKYKKEVGREVVKLEKWIDSRINK